MRSSFAARSRRSNVIPIVGAPFECHALPPHLANLQWFDFTTGTFDLRLKELIRSRGEAQAVGFLGGR